jgi:hypothetical protein
MRKRRHGHNVRPNGVRIRSRVYSSWGSMIQRCRNPNNSQYHDYGGRGITYDPAWSNFENFLRDMGECPPGHTLERIDNNGSYCKANCKWATRKEQQRNRRANQIIEFRGERRCLTEWSEIVNIKPETIRSRFRTGWTVESALSTPPVSDRSERGKLGYQTRKRNAADPKATIS